MERLALCTCTPLGETDLACMQLAPLEAGPTTGKQEARWGATYSTQLRVLFVRMIKTRRFEALGKQDIIQFLVVGILSGALLYPPPTRAA